MGLPAAFSNLILLNLNTSKNIKRGCSRSPQPANAAPEWYCLLNPEFVQDFWTIGKKFTQVLDYGINADTLVI
jgi:hypothetical protein